MARNLPRVTLNKELNTPRPSLGIPEYILPRWCRLFFLLLWHITWWDGVRKGACSDLQLKGIRPIMLGKAWQLATLHQQAGTREWTEVDQAINPSNLLLSARVHLLEIPSKDPPAGKQTLIHISYGISSPSKYSRYCGNVLMELGAQGKTY